MMLGLGLSISAVQRAATFDPSKLANVAHWYRADIGVTQSAGLVSQWNDQIGTAHLVQTTGANQPSYNATDAAYNNQATIQASAISHWLASGAAISTQPITVWAVGEFSTAGAVFVGLSTGTPILYGPASVITASAGTGLGSGVAIGSKAAILTTYNGGSSFIGVNNWIAGGVSGVAGASNGTHIAVLAYANGTFSTVGKIAELIIQAGVPTAQEKTNMAAYFARYGVVVT